jgi:hypothetical protein
VTLGNYRHLLLIVQPTIGIDDDGSEQNFSTFFRQGRHRSGTVILLGVACEMIDCSLFG